MLASELRATEPFTSEAAPSWSVPPLAVSSFGAAAFLVGAGLRVFFFFVAEWAGTGEMRTAVRMAMATARARVGRRIIEGENTFPGGGWCKSGAIVAE